jgi:molybdate transport system substrate-binding protein
MNVSTLRRRAVVVAVWLAVSVVAPAHAAEIKLLSAGAMKSIVSELAEQFQKETGHTVVIVDSGPVGTMQKRLIEGEPVDLVILSDTAINFLISKGYVIGGTRTDLARTAIGVAVREGAARPDISTSETFKRTLLEAKSIVYVDPARGATSGVHFAEVLQRLGIADAVKPKTVLVPGGAAAEKVATGEAEICVHQISEILPVKGVTLVGPLPRDLQKVTTYSAGVPARVSVPDVALAFVAFMARPAVKPRLAEVGLDYRE